MCSKVCSGLFSYLKNSTKANYNCVFCYIFSIPRSNVATCSNTLEVVAATSPYQPSHYNSQTEYVSIFNQNIPCYKSKHSLLVQLHSKT
jgi:hypothetical protein